MSSQKKVHLKSPSPTAGKGEMASTLSVSRSEASLEPHRTRYVSPGIYTANGGKEKESDPLTMCFNIIPLFASNGNVQRLSRTFVHITPCFLPVLQGTPSLNKLFRSY
jgi:hypothetical protein